MSKVTSGSNTGYIRGLVGKSLTGKSQFYNEGEIYLQEGQGQ